MTGLEIAALVAMLGGAAVQYQAGTEAQERQAREIQASLENQRKLQMQAEQKAMDTAAKFDPSTRIAERDQIAQEITADLIEPVSESQAIRSEAVTTQGNVSDDYTTAKAASDLQTLKQAEQLARLLGKAQSSGRLRMNEGIRLMDTGMEIDRLNNFSRGQAGADQIAINQAGQVDPGKVFLGQLLQTAGSAGFMTGGGAESNIGTAGKYGTNPGSTQTAMLAAQDAGLQSASFSDWLKGFTQARI